MKKYIHLSFVGIFLAILAACMRLPPIAANEAFSNKFYMEWDGNPVIPTADYAIPVEIHVFDSILSVHVTDEAFDFLIRITRFTGPGTYYFEDFSDSTYRHSNTAVFYDNHLISTYTQVNHESFLRILEYNPGGTHPAVTGIFYFYLSNDSLETRLEKGYFMWNKIYFY